MDDIAAVIEFFVARASWPKCVIVEAIDKFESLLFGFCIMLSLSFKNFLAAQTASSDPEKVGMMLSNFCLKEAIAVKRPRTEGCKTMSGWIKTALNKGCG
jgi:hypothetical protein